MQRWHRIKYIEIYTYIFKYGRVCHVDPISFLFPVVFVAATNCDCVLRLKQERVAGCGTAAAPAAGCRGERESLLLITTSGRPPRHEVHGGFPRTHVRTNLRMHIEGLNIGISYTEPECTYTVLDATPHALVAINKSETCQTVTPKIQNIAACRHREMRTTSPSNIHAINNA